MATTGKDKLWHYLACLAISIIGGVIAYLCGLGKEWALGIGIGAALLAGIAKEAYDMIFKHAEFPNCVDDFGADLAGGVTGMVILAIIGIFI